jgi:hypothetical protein
MTKGGYMRLSFRLDDSGAKVWRALRIRHAGESDAHIMRELLRAEGYRLQGNTKDDRLNEILAEVRKAPPGAIGEIGDKMERIERTTNEIHSLLVERMQNDHG